MPRALGGALLGMLVASAGLAADAQPTPAPQPARGMDPDGRIPAIDKPPELEHPERWRYLPEARLKKGDPLDRFLVSTFVVPLFSSDDDVGFGGGIGVFDMDFRGSRRRERAGLLASYTTGGEQRYGAFWRRLLEHREVPTGGVLFEERSFIDLDVDYRRSLTERFFGLGPDTREEDETSYTDESLSVTAAVQHSLDAPLDDLVVLGEVRFETHHLGRGRIDDRPSATDLFPELLEEADGNDLLWLSVALSHDTRDSPVQPFRGVELSARIDTAIVQTRGDPAARWSLRASRVFPVPGLFHTGGRGAEEHPPTDTVAIGLRTEGVWGDLPFEVLPSLGGGDEHRGYIGGRFRGEAAWLGLVEYRVWVLERGLAFSDDIRVERIGFAPFYEVGAVADDWPGLFESRLRHSYGAGLRISIDRDVLLRFDLGFSEDGTNFAIGFGPTF